MLQAVQDGSIFTRRSASIQIHLSLFRCANLKNCKWLEPAVAAEILRKVLTECNLCLVSREQQRHRHHQHHQDFEHIRLAIFLAKTVLSGVPQKCYFLGISKASNGLPSNAMNKCYEWIYYYLHYILIYYYYQFHFKTVHEGFLCATGKHGASNPELDLFIFFTAISTMYNMQQVSAASCTRSHIEQISELEGDKWTRKCTKGEGPATSAHSFLYPSCPVFL